MNGTAQRDRHTAVSRINASVADMATLLEELDGRIAALAQIVETLDKRQVEISQGTADAYDALAERLTAALTDRDARIAEWEALTLWERLRWLVRGHA